MAKAGLVNYISSAQILLSTTQVISSNGGFGPQTGRREKRRENMYPGVKELRAVVGVGLSPEAHKLL